MFLHPSLWKLWGWRHLSSFLVRLYIKVERFWVTACKLLQQVLQTCAQGCDHIPVILAFTFAESCWTNMKFWLNTCCQWKSWKSVNILRAGCVCKSTRQRTATGKERKAWRKAWEGTSSAKPSGIAVAKSALPHRDPCSSLKAVGNISSNGYCNESRKEKKGREEEIILEALLSLTRVFFMESITSSWVSYTTGAFCTSFQTVLWVDSHALSHVWHDLESCHSAAAWLGKLAWLTFAICKALPNFLPQASLRLCAAYQTPVSQVFQSSHRYLAPLRDFSLALSSPENICCGLKCESTNSMRKKESCG